MGRYRIALTGTLGVMGSRLLRRLEADDACRRLVLLDLVPPAREVKKARFYRVDLTEPTASTRLLDALERERPDVLVHLAFLQHPIQSGAYAHELESLGTMHVVHALTELARRGRAPHLVLASSTLVYGARAENPSFLSEDAPLEGRRDYPLVGEKIDAERRVEAFSRRSGVAATVLRLAPLLGAEAWTLASRYLSLRAAPTILGFNPMIQTLGLVDAVEALCAATCRSAPDGHRAYNVCASGVVPLHTALRICGRRGVPLLRFAAATMIDALFHAGLAIAPSQHLDYLQHPCVADGERAWKELGFAPAESTRDTLAAFARSRLPRAA